MEDNIFILAVGFLAQAFFSARTLVQWIMSERARKVLSPSIFWILSIIASYLMCLYGWLRDDFAIILGQFITYYIYIWNLDIKGVWKKVPRVIRYGLLATPIIAALWMIFAHGTEVLDLFDDDIPRWLLIFGTFGQLFFTFRFIYQWWESRKIQNSVLSKGFWTISITGSLIILIYAILRKDPVLMLGQSFGIIAYSRNLFLAFKQKKDKA